MKPPSRLLPATLMLLCALAGAEPAPETKIALDIHAVSMEEALNEFARQTGLQLIFPAEEVTEGMAAPRIAGSFTPQAALTQLLADSGLYYQFINPNTVAIRSAKSAPADKKASALEESAAVGDVSMRLAQVEPSSSQGEGQGEDVKKEEAEEEERAVRGIPEILVRGKKGQFSLNADIERTRDDVRPYVVIDRESIERSAATSVDELLRQKLPMSYVRAPNAQIANAESSVGNQSTIALRGLVGTETLILIDGRRSVTRRSRLTEFQSDLNGIPLSAIERIEVLPATASGIYGGSATGGVVNVVLRRDYSGLESTLTYQNTFEQGGGVRSVGLFGGFGFAEGTGSIQFSGSYSDSDELLLKDRGFLEARRRKVISEQIARNPSAFYNSGTPLLGSTVNISSTRVGTSAPNLVLKNGQALNSPITSLPVDYAGVTSDNGAALVANAGTYNLELPNSSQIGGGNSSFLGAPIVASASSTLRKSFGGNVETFLELTATRNDQSYERSNLSAVFSIPGSSPANPFFQTIRVNAPLEGLSQTISTKTDDWRALLGTNVTLSGNWAVAADYSFSSSLTGQSYPSQLLASAGSAVSSGLVNLIQDPAAYTSSILSFALPEGSVSPTRARLSDGSLRFAGPLLSTPAGKAELSLLLEHRKQFYGEWSNTLFSSTGSSTTNLFSDGTSTVFSSYAEVRIPFASPEKRLFGLREAQLQLAARRDHYKLSATRAITATSISERAGQEVVSTDPSIGIRFVPVQGLILRTSYGTGFLPPYLGQLQSSAPRTISVVDFNLRDPKRGGEAIQTLTLFSGGNPELNPERSRNWSAGFVVSPTQVPNLRLSLDWTKIEKSDNITNIGLTQPALDSEDLYTGLFTRAPVAPGDVFGVGPVISFDQRLFNATSATSESFDLAFDYSFETQGIGRWSLSINATKLLHNALQSNPLVLPVERAGTVVSPTWAGNAMLTWSSRNIDIVWTTRYLDAYWFNAAHTIDVAQGSDMLAAQTYHDLTAKFRLGSYGGIASVLSAMEIQLGVKNVFNTPPRYYASGANYYDSWSDPRMATYFLSLKKTFANGT